MPDGDELTVTLPVKALRELVRRSDLVEMHVNLPQTSVGHFYRALRLRWSMEDREDPTLHVTEEENGRSLRTVEVRTSTLFALVPLVVRLLTPRNDSARTRCTD